MMLSIERTRSPKAAERDEILELIADSTRSLGYRPMSDHHWLEFHHHGPGFAAVIGRDEESSRVVAYAQVASSSGESSIELVIHPSSVAQLELVGAEVMRPALEAVAADGARRGTEVRWWTFDPTSGHERLAALLGFIAERSLLQMRCDLPLDPSAGDRVPTRAFDPGRDVEAWLSINNRAFADHPEQGGWTAATFGARLAEDWFDVDGFRIAELDGRMAGFCWTKVHLETVPVGEIYVIAVDPEFHGRGLGRGLAVAGLGHLADRGVTAGMLFVDGRNEAAVGLYRSLGFWTSRTDRSFVRRMPVQGAT